MMEQGSLADLLTLAKSGDDNKLGEMMAMMNGGMGGQQWMWWILIILFAFGGFGNSMFGRNMAPNGLDNANQLILEKLNGMSVEQCGQFSRVGNGICDSTYAITNAVRDARDAASKCCCETNLNIERSTNAAQRATDALSHQLSDCCCQTQLRMQDLATGIREQATANHFQNQQEFCDIKTRMAANHCETLAAIQANQAAIIGYMTQEKISGLERENAALTMQLSQNAQTRAIIEALSKTSTTTPAA